MPLTVIQNAYLRVAESHPNFSETHKKIMLVLLHEKKHYTLEELSCFANYSEEKLVSALEDLEEAGLVKKEGWLVSLADTAALERSITEKGPALAFGAIPCGGRKAKKKPANA